MSNFDEAQRRFLEGLFCENKAFINRFEAVQKDVHANARAHGWWEEPREDGTLIALIMSEAAEALEALRKGNGPDEHCPQFSGAEVELADVIIRIMDMAESRGWDVAGAIVAKHEFNKTRPYKHGKEF